MSLYESDPALATQPGSLAPGAPGIHGALDGFISMKGKLDLEVTRVLEVDDLALVIGVWSFGSRRGTPTCCGARPTAPGAS